MRASWLAGIHKSFGRFGAWWLAGLQLRYPQVKKNKNQSWENEFNCQRYISRVIHSWIHYCGGLLSILSNRLKCNEEMLCENFSKWFVGLDADGNVELSTLLKYTVGLECEKHQTNKYYIIPVVE